MDHSQLNRRDFQRLTAAAVGGLMAGAAAGSSASAADKAPQKDKNKNAMLGEPHVCRGINMCKGLGASKDNACAGQGTCATAAAHTCHAANDCRGQGGCVRQARREQLQGQGRVRRADGHQDLEEGPRPFRGADGQRGQEGWPGAGEEVKRSRAATEHCGRAC